MPDTSTFPSAPVQLGDSATLLTPRGPLGPFTIRSLSSTGAILRGRTPLALGERARIALELRGGRPLGLTAHLIRIDFHADEGPLFAVGFEDVPDDVARALRRALLERLQRATARLRPRKLCG